VHVAKLQISGYRIVDKKSRPMLAIYTRILGLKKNAQYSMLFKKPIPKMMILNF
jgi:hypothetical protein